MSIGENKGKVIGDFGDFVKVPYVPSTESIMAHLTTGYFHVHGASFVLPKYANPVTLTSAAAAWATTGTPDASFGTVGKRLYIPKNNTDIMLISADNSSDRFYARCVKTGATAKVSVDI